MKKISILLTVLILGGHAASAALKNFYAQGPVNKKQIALTFDDGPGPETKKFLELLKENDVKVTFFMLGELVKTQPALAKQVKDAGHEIGSHTYTHKNYKSRLKELIKKFGESREYHPKAEEEVRQELLSAMRKAKSVTEEAIGSKIYLCRMPHGIDATWVRETGHEAGFVLVNWTYGADWTADSPGDLIKSYTNAIRPGAILLLHDGGIKREKTLAITEAVIKAAREKGYSIVPVGQLLGIPAN